MMNERFANYLRATLIIVAMVIMIVAIDAQADRLDDQRAKMNAEFNAKIKAVEAAQDQLKNEIDEARALREQVKQHEYLLRSRQPVSRGISRQAIITAYTCGPESTGKRPGDLEYCVTASGLRLQQSDAWKYVAADPKHYRLGQQIRIDGIGSVVVADTGGDIKGPNRFDIFVGEADTVLARTWGARRKAVQE